MGISWIPQIRAVSSSTMKFFVVASALVAACMAEADPALFYGGYGYPYAYGLHAFAGKSAPCVNAANQPVPCAGAPLAYAGYPYAPVAYGRDLLMLSRRLMPPWSTLDMVTPTLTDMSPSALAPVWTPSPRD